MGQLFRFPQTGLIPAGTHCRQLIQRIPAQAVEHGSRQGKAVLQLHSDRTAAEGCAAGFVKLVADASLGESGLFRFRNAGAVHNNAVSVAVLSQQLCVESCLYDCAEAYAHAALLACGVAAAGFGEELVCALVGFCANSEHIIFLSGEVTVGEALSGESESELFIVLFGGSLALTDSL